MLKVNIESLKKTSNPNVIYSLTDEAEAIANACRENGITVTAFCDNEIRKTKKKYLRASASNCTGVAVPKGATGRTLERH